MQRRWHECENEQNNPVMINERLVKAFIELLEKMQVEGVVGDYGAAIYGETWEMMKSNQAEIFKELDEYEKSQQAANGRAKK
jgi:hypothetical protein